MKWRLGFCLFFGLAMTGQLEAGSATWNLAPTSGDWNTPANWTPPSIPNGPADIATFDVSDQTEVSVSTLTEVNEIAFTSGADPFEITVNPSSILTISGTGIVNDSGVYQKFVTISGNGPADAEINFTNSANAGTSTRITNTASGFSSGVARTLFFGDSSAGEGLILNEGSTVSGPGGNGVTIFYDESKAAEASITNTGGAVSGATGGATMFFDHSTAAHAIFANLAGVEGSILEQGIDFADKSSAGSARFTNFGGRSANAPGSRMSFSGRATAANSTVVNNGGETTNASGGFTEFFDNSTADNSNLTANVGIAGGLGGSFVFYDNSSGGTARVTLYGDATLFLNFHNAPGMKLGSIEGSGLVVLGANRLTVGSNNLDTTFSGLIEDDGLGGSMRKIGSGGLALSGANTYTGGTVVMRGRLIINNLTGSGTGSGPIAVDGGRLAGKGFVTGPVTIGNGTGNKATFAPGVEGVGLFTIQDSLTFAANGSYNWSFEPETVTADEISAAGVTITAGAQFSAIGHRGAKVPLGTIFTVIDNTAASLIDGTFVNLADGAIVTVNGNSFQASYEGGDGNDLTLTVVP